MEKCGRLTAARNLHAWFDGTRKQVTISADVELNPYTTKAHICPNPLSRIIPAPEAREFLVEAVDTSHGGIVPLPVIVTRVYYSFHSDETPAKVRIFTLGIDNPAAQDIPVKELPPPPLAGGVTTSPATHASSDAAKRDKLEGHGWSDSYSYEEALKAALDDLQAKAPPRLPDIGIAAEVIKVVAHAGGNFRPGLEIVIRG